MHLLKIFPRGGHKVTLERSFHMILNKCYRFLLQQHSWIVVQSQRWRGTPVRKLEPLTSQGMLPPHLTLHYKEFITENKISSQSILRFFILSFFKHNYTCSFSMMTAILLFHASSNSSDPFHSPSQHMKNRDHGSIFDI